jgi:tRNA(fMet)-specific endonuclease VapC
MIRFLLDTDCAVYAMRGEYPALRARLGECEPGEVAISAVAYAEIMLGTGLGKPPVDEVVDAFLEEIPIIPFDEAAARAYARLPFQRARFDRLIAAHALSIGAAVVTNNEMDFSDVPGLRIENWTKE